MTSADLDALHSFAHHLAPVKVRGRLLPRLWFLTDGSRVADPLAVIAGMPHGSGVVLRDYGLADRADLAARLAAATQKHGHHLLVADDPKLALALNADGIHFPERSMGRLKDFRVHHPDILVTVSAHSATALAVAEKAGADAAFVAPVFATESHPGAPFLGVAGLAAILSKTHLPVIALGGIEGKTVDSLAGLPLAGIAAIGALS